MVVDQVADILPRFLLDLIYPVKKNVDSFLNVVSVYNCAVATLAFNYFVSCNVKISSLFFAPIMQKFCVTIIALLCKLTTR